MFCRERSIDPISTLLDQPIEFLIKIFQSGVAYSSVGTVRYALTSALIMDNVISFGVWEFAVWHPDIVLDYLSNLEYNLTLKDLSKKLAVPLCLLYGQREEAMNALNIKDIVL